MDVVTRRRRRVPAKRDIAARSARLANRVPAWARPTQGEHRAPVVAAVLLVVGLQMLVPRPLAVPPHWLLPAAQFVLLAGITAVNPGRVSHSRSLRSASLALIGVLSIGNGVSAARLTSALVHGGYRDDAGPLLMTGAGIWATNVAVFALWYWELDGGGPRCRGGRSC